MLESIGFGLLLLAIAFISPSFRKFVSSTFSEMKSRPRVAIIFTVIFLIGLIPAYFVIEFVINSSWFTSMLN